MTLLPAHRKKNPTILFGAFDRHNFGDLLFPHIVAALLQDFNLVYAGLLNRDMRCYGGHQVIALPQLVEVYRDQPINLIHVGGELLTCSAWQAAIMLLSSTQAQEIIARFDKDPKQKLEWAKKFLGLSSLAPYSVPWAKIHSMGRVIYNAVGGVDLNKCEPAMLAEVLKNLGLADEVSVRDKQTQAILQAENISARLIPDPVVMIAELFGNRIGQCVEDKEIAQIHATFPQGYIAVQYSADFGDDATLIEIATQLDQASSESGYGIVFFRAGAAPWHDDLDCYQRAVTHMRSPAIIFASLNIWDICALISSSQLFCGSSLHGRIVALAYALPRINLRHPSELNRFTKQESFAHTWEQPDMPAVVDLANIADGIRCALTTDVLSRQQKAKELATQYREGFRIISDSLK